MHWFDISVTVAFFLSGLWSFCRGLMRELLSLAGLLVASVLALRGYPHVADWLAPSIATPGIRQALGFAVIFLAVMVVTVLCGILARLLLKAVGLSLLDRLCGGCFGCVKVLLLASVTLILLTKFAPSLSAQLAQESLFAPYLFRSATWLTTFLEKHDDMVQQFYKQLPMP